MMRFLKSLMLTVLYICGILVFVFALMFLLVDHDTFAFALVTLVSAVFLVPAILITIKAINKKKAELAESKARYEAKIQAEKDREREWLNGEGRDFKKVIDNFFVDEKNQKLRVYDNFVEWKKIIGSQIISDEEVISTSVSNGYQTGKRGSVGRAVVGGFLFGGVGAIVGANTGTQKTKVHTTTTTTSNNYCKSLFLRIYLDSVDEPYIDFTFIDHQINKNSDLFKQKNEEIAKCNGIIKVILNRIDGVDD